MKLIMIIVAALVAIASAAPQPAQAQTQQVQAENAPVELSPTEQLTAAVSALTEAFDRYDADKSAVTTAGDAASRAREALRTAEERETAVGVTATATASDVSNAIEAAISTLEAIKVDFE